MSSSAAVFEDSLFRFVDKFLYYGFNITVLPETRIRIVKAYVFLYFIRQHEICWDPRDASVSVQTNI